MELEVWNGLEIGQCRPLIIETPFVEGLNVAIPVTIPIKVVRRAYVGSQ